VAIVWIYTEGLLRDKTRIGIISVGDDFSPFHSPMSAGALPWLMSCLKYLRSAPSLDSLSGEGRKVFQVNDSQGEVIRREFKGLWVHGFYTVKV
jgi:hypothetical protein